MTKKKVKSLQQREEEARPIMKKIKEALLKANELREYGDWQKVEQMNDQAVKLMMLGNIEGALMLFLKAIEKSGKDMELRARSLINIGDYLRRILGALDSAREIISLAEKLLSSRSLVTKSRLKAMEGMIYIFPMEHGEKENDRKAIKMTIDTLQEAVNLAKLAYKLDPKVALKAYSFALHRLVAQMARRGTLKQKAIAIKEIKEFFTYIDPDSDEAARFNYTKAIIIAEKKPEEAARLLLESAIRLYKDSPYDAGPFFRIAAEVYFKMDRLEMAWQCLEQARSFLPLYYKLALEEPEIKKFKEVEAKIKKELNKHLKTRA